MKIFLKSSFLIFLAITIIFSSAFVGFGEINFSGINFSGVSEFFKSVTPDFSVKSQAANVVDSGTTCGDNLTWALDDEGTLTISGTGDLWNDGFGYPWDSVRSSIEAVVINNGVESIGDNSFYRYTNLTSITIPDSVTSIGSYAFYDCDSLTSITIPDSVTSIGSCAFNDCESLTSITIPDSVTSIGSSAFYNTAYYNNSSNWENGVLYIGNHLIEAETTLSGEYTIKNGTKTIADSAFYDCDSLTSITIPNSVTSISDSAFCDCEGLTSITIPDSVTSIGDSAFRDCESLNAITIPDSVTSIGNSAFYDCFDLTSIVIPDSVTSIASKTFEGCLNLAYITIPDSVRSIGEYAFYGCAWILGVFYTGTQSQWSEIELGRYNENLTKSVIHFESVDHTAGEWVTTKDPTCIEKGLREKYCVVCNEQLCSEEISVKAHSSDEWIVDSTPTCINSGLKHKACDDCGTIFAIEAIQVNGHNSSDWITDVKATVDKVGSKHKECTECGETLKTEKITQLKCSRPSLKKIENTADGVKITWGKVTGADSYAVYRKTGSGKYTKIATVKGNSKVTYTDKKAKSGKKYYYNVKAVNEAGESSASKAKSILYLADTTLSTPKSTKNGITLKWKKVTGAEGYQVWCKTGNGSYKKIATVKGNAKVTYTYKKAKKGKTYTYKIKAYKSKTTSAYSNAKKIKDKY